VDMDISMDIHEKSVDMDMDMDAIFHIHGNPGIAVSVRLDMAICVPHSCHCGSLVDAYGLHSFICRKAPGKITRHLALNDLVARAFTSAGIPSSKEPHGLVRSDGKGRFFGREIIQTSHAERYRCTNWCSRWGPSCQRAS